MPASKKSEAKSLKKEVADYSTDVDLKDDYSKNLQDPSLPYSIPSVQAHPVSNGRAIKIKYNLDKVNKLAVKDKIGLIKTGFSKDQLEDIKEESDLDYDTLSTVLSVSRAKLINKKGSEKFDQLTSERIMLLADLISYGQSVFEDKERFNQWMKRPSKALGEKTPLELMDTVYGIDEIKKELGRIEYGVY